MSEEQDTQKGANAQNPHDNSNVTPQSSEPTETKQLATDDQQQRIENMETHAHHLHKASGHGWKHYFFEFLMLFLAVFCGFLAEYLLEHKIEADREQQYVRSMVEDLKLDTAALNRIIELRTRRVKNLDSVSLLLNEPIDTNYLSTLYYSSLLIRRAAMIRFVYNDRTIQQLKNSGGLRLIRNQIVSDSIVLYDSRVRRLEKTEENEREYILSLIPYSNKIFDGRVYDKMTSEDDKISRPAGNPALLPYTKSDLNGFISSLHSVKSGNIAYRAFSMELYNTAVSLLKTVKQEYHLK